MYDLIIKNGSVIDGTGSPSFRSDIAVKNGKTVKILRNIAGDSKKIIDAKGLTVTQGFIDFHSHSDSAVFTYPEMIDEAVAEGYDVYCDVYPYTASATSLVATIIPKEFRDMDNESFAKLLCDDEIRNKRHTLWKIRKKS